MGRPAPHAGEGPLTFALAAGQARPRAGLSLQFLHHECLQFRYALSEPRARVVDLSPSWVRVMDAGEVSCLPVDAENISASTIIDTIDLCSIEECFINTQTGMQVAVGCTSAWCSSPPLGSPPSGEDNRRGLILDPGSSHSSLARNRGE